MVVFTLVHCNDIVIRSVRKGHYKSNYLRISWILLNGLYTFYCLNIVFGDYFLYSQTLFVHIMCLLSILSSFLKSAGLSSSSALVCCSGLATVHGNGLELSKVGY